jgi:RNA polymerase sigma-70 factor (ECF subfamily)
VPGATVEATTASSEDLRLVSELRSGKEEAFAALVDMYHASLIRLAMTYVRDRAVAEEVAQETWLGVIKGIDRFEGRSSLKTWIFRIMTNTAKTRGERESRTVPFSALAGDDAGETAVEPERFIDQNAERWGNHWATPPASWSGVPESRLLAKETLGVIEEALGKLPPAQRQVITLRDVQGWPSEEVCDLLEVSEANQRVLLHRARSKVRRALEAYLDDTDSSAEEA